MPTIFFGEDQFPDEFPVPPLGNAATARNAFLDGLSGVGNEDFEGFDVGTATPLAISFPGSSGSITATISGDGLVENNFGDAGSGGLDFGRYNTSAGGAQYWESGSSFVITFSAPISAFGFYATDVGDFEGQVTLTLTNGGDPVDLTVPNTVSGEDAALLFYGFIDPDTSYTSIAFGNTSGFGVDFFGFDDMVIGDKEQIIAPEPGTASLVALSGLGVGAALRRRARSGVR